MRKTITCDNGLENRYYRELHKGLGGNIYKICCDCCIESLNVAFLTVISLQSCYFLKFIFGKKKSGLIGGMLIFCFQVTKKMLKFSVAQGGEDLEVDFVSATGGSADFCFDLTNEVALGATGILLRDQYLGQIVFANAGHVACQRFLKKLHAAF